MPKRAYILPATEISHHRWDECVQQSENGLIYARTNYLNAMAPHWHGVVIGDYTAVMPIPWRMKFGFRYAYMPAFMQQLGLIGNYDEADLKALLRTLPDFISYGDIHFNFSNAAVCGHNATSKTNLVINLEKGVDTIRASYRGDLKENIRKAATHGLKYLHNGDVADAVAQYRSHYAIRMPHTKDTDYQHFQTLCLSLYASGNCLIRKVTDEQGTLLAIALFLKDEKRIYNLMNTTLADGRSKEANHFLLDNLVNEFAGQSLLLDFEGSELPGVRSFYQQFGAEVQPYFHYHHNSLPWWLRLVKR